jgi:hypothetical protein
MKKPPPADLVQADIKLKILDWQMKFLMAVLTGFVVFLVVHSSQMAGFGVRLETFVKDIEGMKTELGGVKDEIVILKTELSELKGYSKAQVEILRQIRDSVKKP